MGPLCRAHGYHGLDSRLYVSNKLKQQGHMLNKDSCTVFLEYATIKQVKTKALACRPRVSLYIEKIINKFIPRELKSPFKTY